MITHFNWVSVDFTILFHERINDIAY